MKVRPPLSYLDSPAQRDEAPSFYGHALTTLGLPSLEFPHGPVAQSLRPRTRYQYPDPAGGTDGSLALASEVPVTMHASSR